MKTIKRKSYRITHCVDEGGGGGGGRGHAFWQKWGWGAMRCNCSYTAEYHFRTRGYSNEHVNCDMPNQGYIFQFHWLTELLKNTAYKEVNPTNSLSRTWIRFIFWVYNLWQHVVWWVRTNVSTENICHHEVTSSMLLRNLCVQQSDLVVLYPGRRQRDYISIV